jgi:excinuclease ABC subunit A
VRYKGRNIHEVLEMTASAAQEFFSAVPAIARKLRTLIEVGLGYVRLGQSATTLSGGEAQRVKLALELSKRDTGRTLYILDEPTTGLHFQDIRLLLEVLERLRDAGNTVVVIEHNLEVVKSADWIVDLGPEGGDGGGRIVAQGTPEQVAKAAESATGPYLARALKNTNVRTIMPHDEGGGTDGNEQGRAHARGDPRRGAQAGQQGRS